MEGVAHALLAAWAAQAGDARGADDAACLIARTCCISRAWRSAAANDQLWARLFSVRWPGFADGARELLLRQPNDFSGARGVCARALFYGLAKCARRRLALPPNDAAPRAHPELARGAIFVEVTCGAGDGERVLFAGVLSAPLDELGASGAVAAAPSPRTLQLDDAGLLERASWGGFAAWGGNFVFTGCLRVHATLLSLPDGAMCALASERRLASAASAGHGLVSIDCCTVNLPRLTAVMRATCSGGSGDAAPVAGGGEELAHTLVLAVTLEVRPVEGADTGTVAVQQCRARLGWRRPAEVGDAASAPTTTAQPSPGDAQLRAYLHALDWRAPPRNL